jgi:hypothetical protein
MKKKLVIVISFFLLTVLFVLFLIVNQSTVLENTTENIQVISKGRDITTTDQWIVLSNGRKVYIDDFSIWALIKENQNYTIDYNLMKKSGRYELKVIVPGDYNGQF